MKQEKTNGRQAVVLFSGGLDSTTVLAIARDQGFSCNCLSFQYGQRQDVEVERARHICKQLGDVNHLVVRVHLESIGGSALTDDIDVPKGRQPEEMGTDIPVTYVPGRNIIFLSYAVSWAEVLGARDIFLGINAVDYSGYPDCRPEFLDAYSRMANLGTRAGSSGDSFRFHAPLLRLSKKEIIQLGMALGVDYSLTHSCYDPQDGQACGQCDACRLRLQGFAAAGLQDPVPYR